MFSIKLTQLQLFAIEQTNVMLSAVKEVFEWQASTHLLQASVNMGGADRPKVGDERTTLVTGKVERGRALLTVKSKIDFRFCDDQRWHPTAGRILIDSDEFNCKYPGMHCWEPVVFRSDRTL